MDLLLADDPDLERQAVVRRRHHVLLLERAWGMARLPQLVYHFDEQGVRVDLFESGSVRFERGGRKVTLEQQTSYPADGSAQFTVKTEQPVAFALQVRIPEWARNVRVAINGRSVEAAAAGQYTSLERTWSDGDRVSVQFEMTTTRIDMPDGNSAVRRGPEVLSVDAGDNPGLDLKKLVLPAGRNAVEDFAPDGPRRRYVMTLLVDGKSKGVVLTPFAAAGNGQAGYRTTFPGLLLPLGKPNSSALEVEEVPFGSGSLNRTRTKLHKKTPDPILFGSIIAQGSGVAKQGVAR